MFVSMRPFIYLNVDPVVCIKNSSHTLRFEYLRKILKWSEKHFSTCCGQSALSPTLTYTFRESTQCDVRRKSCYLSSKGEVWSAYGWSGTSFTAVEEALIEEIKGDEPIGAGMSTGVAFGQLNK